MTDNDAVFLSIPRCSECGDAKSVAPAVHTYKGQYFCIHCCNYLDRDGRIAG